jgi:hypothetical protein
VPACVCQSRWREIESLRRGLDTLCSCSHGLSRVDLHARLAVGAFAHRAPFLSTLTAFARRAPCPASRRCQHGVQQPQRRRRQQRAQRQQLQRPAARRPARTGHCAALSSGIRRGRSRCSPAAARHILARSARAGQCGFSCFSARPCARPRAAASRRRGHEHADAVPRRAHALSAAAGRRPSGRKGELGTENAPG